MAPIHPTPNSFSLNLDVIKQSQEIRKLYGETKNLKLEKWKLGGVVVGAVLPIVYLFCTGKIQSAIKEVGEVRQLLTDKNASLAVLQHKLDSTQTDYNDSVKIFNVRIAQLKQRDSLIQINKEIILDSVKNLRQEKLKLMDLNLKASGDLTTRNLTIANLYKETSSLRQTIFDTVRVLRMQYFKLEDKAGMEGKKSYRLQMQKNQFQELLKKNNIEIPANLQ